MEITVRNKALQRALFVCSVVLGAAGILGAAWMVAHGDLSYVVGLLSSIFPLSFGMMGLHKLRKSPPVLN
jgi:hypothetical protein